MSNEERHPCCQCALPDDGAYFDEQCLVIGCIVWLPHGKFEQILAIEGTAEFLTGFGSEDLKMKQAPVRGFVVPQPRPVAHAPGCIVEGKPIEAGARIAMATVDLRHEILPCIDPGRSDKRRDGKECVSP